MSDSSPNNTAPAEMLSAEVARSQLGSWLRSARERSGLSIDAVAQETRISKNYIIGLESGNLDALPGKVFGRGFVKNITRLLRSDSVEGLRLYDACWGRAVVLSPVPTDVEAPVEAHKTRSVMARIAEPVNTSTPVARRLITEDFAAVGERPRLPRESALAKLRVSFKAPAWLVRGVMSPHVRLWILASIASVFVLLVFGRWFSQALHNRQISRASRETVAVVDTAAKMSGADTVTDEAVVADSGRQDQISDATSAPYKAAATGVSADSGLSAAAGSQTSAVNAKAMDSDEDNVLYMPSEPTAAFEQVLEFKVAGDVEVRVILDGKKVEKTWYEVNTHRITFNDKAEVYILDASQVDVIYNGKSLGVLGSKGRKRRIVFQAKATETDFPK